MGDLSENFDRHEFECKCGCGQDTVDHELVVALERIRNHYQVPVYITSGNRCPAHNQAVGGSPVSQHLYSKAADFQVQAETPMEVYTLLSVWYPDQFGIGVYDSWVHFDVRKDKARWDKRTE